MQHSSNQGSIMEAQKQNPVVEQRRCQHNFSVSMQTIRRYQYDMAMLKGHGIKAYKFEEISTGGRALLKYL